MTPEEHGERHADDMCACGHLGYLHDDGFGPCVGDNDGRDCACWRMRAEGCECEEA